MAFSSEADNARAVYCREPRDQIEDDTWEETSFECAGQQTKGARNLGRCSAETRVSLSQLLIESFPGPKRALCGPMVGCFRIVGWNSTSWNCRRREAFRAGRNLRPRTACMAFLEGVKKIVEKATGWHRPDDPKALLRKRKPHLYRFKDDGLIPNNPRWPFVIYKSVIRLPESLDPAAVFEELFKSNGWDDLWRDGIYDWLHYHSRVHEVLGIARGSAKVQFGGTKGRTVTLRAGDVAILPAGTGHQCFKASDDFLVVGAYPPTGTYDECTSVKDRKKALSSIPKTARPRKDPVYGKDGPLLRAWRKTDRKRK
jgi:uncharacterized protein YjlB